MTTEFDGFSDGTIAEFEPTADGSADEVFERVFNGATDGVIDIFFDTGVEATVAGTLGKSRAGSSCGTREIAHAMA